MIRTMSIRNFKCLREISIDLERFTVFVGPNASGKSSILQALQFLCHLFRADNPQNNDEELRQGLSRGATGPIELAAEIGDQAFRYRTQSPASQPRPTRAAQPEWNGEGRGIAASLTSSDWKQWTPKATVPISLPRSVLLRLEASKLVVPTPDAQDPAVMSPLGAGLHSALASMALNDPDSWQLLQANLRRIIPSIRRLRHTKTNANKPLALLFDTVGADSVPAHQISEGTLLVLGLLAALHASSRPKNLVLLDDLDRGLHPKAQKELIALLRGLLDTNPDLQIVATTHSPYMLDSMDVNEVRMTFLKEDGATMCAALTNHPQFPKWKDEMTPGEMWSLFGEKWVAEEVPA